MGKRRVDEIARKRGRPRLFNEDAFIDAVRQDARRLDDVFVALTAAGTSSVVARGVQSWLLGKAMGHDDVLFVSHGTRAKYRRALAELPTGALTAPRARRVA